jgi:hypothetical protein
MTFKNDLRYQRSTGDYCDVYFLLQYNNPIFFGLVSLLPSTDIFPDSRLLVTELWLSDHSAGCPPL